jgi:hypothetical protein
LGGGKAEKKKTRNADQIRGAKAVGRRRVFVPRKRREEKKRKDFHVHTFGFPFSVGLVGRFSWKAFRQPKRTKETRRARAEQDTNNKEDEEWKTYVLQTSLPQTFWKQETVPTTL